MGTLAFGSLVITIFYLIRVILELTDDALKKRKNSKIVRCILCCMKCIFWCFERFLRVLNKNAYIMCAIHGKPFCISACDAFSLLKRNFLRTIVLNRVTGSLFFITKIMVSLAMGTVTYFYFSSHKFKDKLNYIPVPVGIVMFGTYLIASVFFAVYSTAVDTLFLCFCMFHSKFTQSFVFYLLL